MKRFVLLLGLLAGFAAFDAPSLAQEPEDAGPPADSAPARAARTARAMLTPAEYLDRASHLRELYRKPPAEWPAPTLDEGVVHEELGKVPKVVHPESNPLSDSKRKLGFMLFFEPRLSGSAQIACASCHDPDLAWTDGRTVAFGHGRQRLNRNTSTLLNIGNARSIYWDGRVSTIEAQARAVIESHGEMRGNEAQIRERLSAHEAYRKLFAEAFGSEEINLDRITQALACFERTIVTRRNPFDQFLDGDANALSDSAIRGLHLFRTDARCLNCHGGSRFTDDKFHNLGLSYYGRKYEDLGRYYITGDAADVGSFKTPTLRNIAKTGPYLHNGFFALDPVLRFYNIGMPTLRRKPHQEDDKLFPTKDPLLKPLSLNQQDLADLKAFLESLTELPLRVFPPDLPGLPD